MRALLTGAITAIEGIAAALTTLLIVTGIAFLIWWLSFDLSSEPLEVLQIAGSAWLLAHLVPLTVELSAETMQALGFAAEPMSFVLSLAPLGVTLVSVAFAVRSGWRLGGRGGRGAAGVLGGAVGFGAVAGGADTYVSISALPIALTVLVPALVYGVPAAGAFLVRAATEQHEWWDDLWTRVGAWLGTLKVRRTRVLRERTAGAARLVGMLVAGYVGLAAIAFACAIVIGFARVIGAGQAMQLDVWGVIMMFVLQLALLPIFVVWSGAWLTGAGFAVGLGSSASPFGALLGPMPGLPVFAAIPDGWGMGAVLAPVALTLVGVAVGTAFGKTARRCSGIGFTAVAVIASIVTGLGVALLSWLASGSLGPGRLEVVGPELWLTAGLAAAELGVGCLLGGFAARANIARRALSFTTSAFSSTNTASEHARADEEPLVPALHAVPPQYATSSDHTTSGQHGDLEVDADDQLTEPLEFPAPIRLKPDPLSEPHEPIETGEYDDDEQVTAPQPDLPIREPELFDQQAALEAAQRAREQAEEQVKPAGPLNPADPDPDSLVEAYSWDRADEVQEEPKPNWRRRRKKR
ncbi:DUF6350 family protein [Leucobacter denitrificans]|uniref:Uncharacterized protein n=1 Tax=Leucobacter denitrificans TaxID=683042 RepID=A0A7G9S6K4_9MICO|nr:DUF6350 family protein [Leucobacter denitrificans]QNN63479.1 hypothetical protein H9L06_03945 [Leucobacter denitrificans]